ncbi:hypothetical protein [Leeuwenhoekiella parthenopeia]|uniref:SMP domain-containing protein n=1 Tax=Leeuwenhoekiella parthenopeia TaxID=2890320 RepID=A0ABS8GYH8_9FLAO|nr:hypothetical protein [Leeuwenhoekiella parthenopeia]MCC4214720.1 hypothetical protein [Leeuwenhoekiella parthenopeia]
MGKSNPMSKAAAARINSATAKSSKSGNVSSNSFAARASSAAAKNSKK